MLLVDAMFAASFALLTAYKSPVWLGWVVGMIVPDCALWFAILPLCFITVTTLTAGFLNIRDNYWPMAVGGDPALTTQGYVNSICTGIMMTCAIIILVATSHRSLSVLSGRAPALSLAEAEV